MKVKGKTKQILFRLLGKFFLYFLATTLAVGLVFYFADDLISIYKGNQEKASPCGQPITYSLGDFDSRFGLSREEFLAAVKEAARVWNRGAGRPVFTPAENGDLKIFLVYDERQDSTIKLKSLGLDISKSKANYESLKAKYDALNQIYLVKKNELEQASVYFAEAKGNYEAEVRAANKRGGVSPEEFLILEAERNALNSQIAQLQQKEEALNKIVGELNALANVINRLIYDLNLNVENYNTIGASKKGEFEEGVYVSDVLGQRIIIYQFDDRAVLVRVLTHELGHALGLEHIDDSSAVMYRLNEGSGGLTAGDLAQLKMACEIR